MAKQSTELKQSDNKSESNDTLNSFLLFTHASIAKAEALIRKGEALQAKQDHVPPCNYKISDISNIK